MRFDALVVRGVQFIVGSLACLVILALFAFLAYGQFFNFFLTFIVALFAFCFPLTSRSVAVQLAGLAYFVAGALLNIFLMSGDEGFGGERYYVLGVLGAEVLAGVMVWLAFALMLMYRFEILRTIKLYGNPSDVARPTLHSLIFRNNRVE